MSSIDLQAKEIKPARNTFTHVAKHIGGDKPATEYSKLTKPVALRLVTRT